MQAIISQQTADAVLQRLDALAAKLGVTAQYVYGVYVQQARVEAVRDTIWFCLLLLVATALFVLARKLFQYGIKHRADEWPFFVGGVTGIGGAVLIMVALGYAYSAVGEWVNPQFWALDTLFRALK